MNAARPFILSVTIASLTLGGCESKIRYEHAKVHGKVTYKGKPVPIGSVLFVPVDPPKDGLMQPASGSINADGTYELKSQADAGAILGEHKVVVIAVDGGKVEAEPSRDAAPAPLPGPSGGGVGSRRNAPQFKSMIPKNYADPSTTPLTRKVVAGDNTIDIEITD